MNLSKIMFSLSLIICVLGCKDNPKTEPINEEQSTTNQQPVLADTTKAAPAKPEKEEFVINGGTFQRDDLDDAAQCPCDCLSVNFEQTQRICIDEESGLSIKVRYLKIDDQLVHMYFESGSGETEVLKNIPWENFDKNQALAKLSFQSPTEFDLNWIGFSQKGKVLVDYALLGEKNLEGHFAKSE